MNEKDHPNEETKQVRAAVKRLNAAAEQRAVTKYHIADVEMGTTAGKLAYELLLDAAVLANSVSQGVEPGGPAHVLSLSDAIELVVEARNMVFNNSGRILPPPELGMSRG